MTEQDILDYTERYKNCIENCETSLHLGRAGLLSEEESNKKASYWLDQAILAEDVLKGRTPPSNTSH